MVNLPAVSGFLTETVNERLKKPLQPANLFASAVFVVLNFFFVYPLLLEQRFGPALAFRDLATAWQLALISVLVLVLSYLLLSVHGGVRKLFTGELWADSVWLAPWLRGMQKGKAERASSTHSKVYQKWRAIYNTKHVAEVMLEKLRNDLKAETDQQKRKVLEQQINAQEETLAELGESVGEYIRLRKALWETTISYPTVQGFLAPTALGNVLNAAATSIWQRYRIDMPTLWPYMESTLATKDSNLRDRIAEDKTALDFLLNTAFVLLLFWVEYVLVRLFWPEPWWATILVSVATPLLAYFAFYRPAVGRGRDWGRAVQMAFDLHRESLRTALGLRKFDSRAHERETWKGVSRWLASGTESEDAVESAKLFPFADEFHAEKWDEDAYFEGGVAVSTPASASVGWHSQNVQVRVSTARRDNETLAPGPVAAVEEYVDYQVVITNVSCGPDAKSCGCEAEGIFVLISDPRLPEIKAAPQQGVDLEIEGAVTQLQVVGEIVSVDKAQAKKHKHDLLWRISKLPASGAVKLSYSLPSAVLRKAEVSPHGDLRILASPVFSHPRYNFKVECINDTTDARLSVYDLNVDPGKTGKGTSYVATATPVPIESTADKDGFHWRIGSMKANEKAMLTYDVKED